MALGGLAWRRRASPRLAGGLPSTAEIELDAVASGRAVIVAWMGVREGAARHIGVSACPDTGERCGPPREVGAPGLVADPSLASAGAGPVDLAWLAFRQNLVDGGEPHDMRVMAASAPPGTADFGSPVQVAPSIRGTRYDRPWAAQGPAGGLWVVYRFERAGREAGLVVAASRDRRSFTPTTVVSSPAFGGALPTLCVAADERRLWVAYVDLTSATVVLRRSQDGGLTWEPDETRVSAEGEPVALEGPSCFADGDEVLVGYPVSNHPMDTGASALVSAFVVARTGDRGRRLVSRSRVSSGDLRWLHPRLARAADGSLGLALLAGRFEGDPGGSLQRLALDPAGRAAGPAEVLRGGLRFLSRRDAPGWGGDYLGFVLGPSRGLVAFAAADRGDARAAVVSFARGAPR